MSCLLQICSIFTLSCWIDVTTGTPLFQGFSVQKGFEVNLKPFNFKPKSFFKENWSPFGSFGVRKEIQKRDLDAITSGNEMPPPRLGPPAPVFEHVEETKPVDERKENTETPATGLRPGPDPVKPISSNLVRVPLTESFKPPTEGLFTSIGRNPPANNFILDRPVQPALGEMYGELPPRPVGPIPAQPMYFIPSQADVPKEVIPLITPPPGPSLSAASNVPISEIPPTDGPIVRGSKMALYFGNVFLQLVSQFLTNARLQFSQFPRQAALPPTPVSN